MRAISLKTSFLLVIGMLAAWVVFIALAPVSNAQTIGYVGYAVVDNTTKYPWTVKANTVDEVKNLNDIYFQNWSRDARADELQFHVDHVTPHDALAAWLQKTTDTYNRGWLAGTAKIDTLNGQTASLPGGRMYLLANGQSRRVYDYPTALSWGLDKNDRVSIEGNVEGYFFERWPEGEPLTYLGGPFYQGIQEYWTARDADTIPAIIPDTLRDYMLQTVPTNIYGNGGTYGSMLWTGNVTTDRSLNALYDWSYIYN